MHRTQIYLPKKYIRYLKKKAAEENISVSGKIRAVIEDDINKNTQLNDAPQKQNPGEWLLSPAEKAKQLGVKGPKDLATNMDKYLLEDMDKHNHNK